MLILRMIIEVSLIGTLLYFVLIKFKVIREMLSLGTFKVSVIVLFLFFWAFVQSIDRWQYKYPDYKIEFFPVERFAMYAHPQLVESFMYHRIEAKYADGSSSDLNTSKLFQGSNTVTINSRMRAILRNFFTEDPTEEKWSEKEAGLFLKSTYNILQFQGEPLPSEINMYRVTVAVDGSTVNKSEDFVCTFNKEMFQNDD